MRNYAKVAALGLIGLYQRTLSLDHGPLRHLYPYGFCRHHPTCSEFGKQVIDQHGVLCGVPRLARRILSCHPWSKVSDAKIQTTIDGMNSP